MPNFDRLASLSKKMKEVRVVVTPGGGQEGSDGATSVPGAPVVPPASFTTSGAASPADGPAAQSAAATDDAAAGAVLTDIRDALRELVAEVRAARTGGMPLTGGVPNAALDDIRAQLEMQGEQLSAILDALKRK